MQSQSRSELLDLLKKLADERIPVHAAFSSATGTKARLSGLVVGFSSEIELVVSGKDDSGYLAVRFADRPFRAFFGDKRELPGDLRVLAEKWGAVQCSITFTDSGDFLALIFDLD